MLNKVTVGIIGTGWVGASVAISTLHAGIVHELLLNDWRAEVAEGEAMDLAHGASFYPAATVRSCPIEEMRSANIIVIAAGRGGGPKDSRLDLLHGNAKIIRDIAQKLDGFDGIVVIVSNPVDVLTHVFLQASDMAPERVIGTGTMLDTARLRQVLGRELRLDPRSIHAQVVGEHGDSEVVLWSNARVSSTRLRSWLEWNETREQAIAKEVRTAAYEIIQRKGATNHAIGLVTADLLTSLLRSERRVLTVSRLQEGALGLKNVTLSLPTIVSADGATQVLEPELAPEELDKLRNSAEVLGRALDTVFASE